MYKNFLEKKKIQNKIDALAKRYKDKKILLYGAGNFLQYIWGYYDFSKLNIIGVADKSFEHYDENKLNTIDVGYQTLNAVLPSEIEKLNPDMILVTTLKPDLIVKYLEKQFKNKSIEKLVDISIIEKMVEKIDLIKHIPYLGVLGFDKVVPKGGAVFYTASSRLNDEIFGVWTDYKINHYTEMVKDVKGDYAEIGVAYGATFNRLVKIAKTQNKHAHAFDSFLGMDDPGEFDGFYYRKGGFDAGGTDKFKEILKSYNVNDGYSLWQGYIPDGFKDFPEDKTFSFVILDVDNYQPTVDSLKWIWPKINKNGLILLDDFCIINEYELASTKAIKEFLREQNDYNIVSYNNQQLVLQKL